MFAKLKQKTLEDKPKPAVQKSSHQDAEEPSKAKVSSVWWALIRYRV